MALNFMFMTVKMNFTSVYDALYDSLLLKVTDGWGEMNLQLQVGSQGSARHSVPSIVVVRSLSGAEVEIPFGVDSDCWADRFASLSLIISLLPFVILHWVFVLPLWDRLEESTRKTPEKK